METATVVIGNIELTITIRRMDDLSNEDGETLLLETGDGITLEN